MNSWWVMRLPTPQRVGIDLDVALRAERGARARGNLRQAPPGECLAGHDVIGLGDVEGRFPPREVSAERELPALGELPAIRKRDRVDDHRATQAGRVALRARVAQRGRERGRPALGEHQVDERGDLAVALAGRVDIEDRDRVAHHGVDGRAVGVRVDDDVAAAQRGHGEAVDRSAVRPGRGVQARHQEASGADRSRVLGIREQRAAVLVEEPAAPAPPGGTRTGRSLRSGAGPRRPDRSRDRPGPRSGRTTASR